MANDSFDISDTTSNQAFRRVARLLPRPMVDREFRSRRCGNKLLTVLQCFGGW